MPLLTARPDCTGVVGLNILRVQGTSIGAVDDSVAVEEPLEIQLRYEKSPDILVTRSVSITMRTPGSDPELAAGFLFTEGILDHRDQIQEIAPATGGAHTPLDGNRLCVTLRPGVSVDLRTLERHFYTTSSCGVCGKTSLEALRANRQITLAPGTPRIDANIVAALPRTLRQTQSLFDQTGGLHAAALFNPDGALLGVREDVGRHNAVDKLIGGELLAGRVPLNHSILFLSGRVSFELMQKAAMAGIPIIAAVGAPSNLAVDTARELGATLIGFVRENRFNVYAGTDRILNLDTFEPTR